MRSSSIYIFDDRGWLKEKQQILQSVLKTWYAQKHVDYGNYPNFWVRQMKKLEHEGRHRG